MSFMNNLFFLSFKQIFNLIDDFIFGKNKSFELLFLRFKFILLLLSFLDCFVDFIRKLCNEDITLVKLLVEI